MQSRIAYIVYDEEHRAFIRFCNSLRCPLCDGQLDGNVQKKYARLHCVNNNEEYICELEPNKDFEVEQFTFWYPQYQYTVCIGKRNEYYLSTVDRYNMDAAPIHRIRTKKEIFRYIGDKLLFFRSRMEEDQFLKKLKIYNTFS